MLGQSDGRSEHIMRWARRLKWQLLFLTSVAYFLKLWSNNNNRILKRSSCYLLKMIIRSKNLMKSIFFKLRGLKFT